MKNWRRRNAFPGPRVPWWPVPGTLRCCKELLESAIATLCTLERSFCKFNVPPWNGLKYIIYKTPKYLAEMELFWKHQLRVFVSNGSRGHCYRKDVWVWLNSGFKFICNNMDSNLNSDVTFFSFWYLSLVISASVLLKDRLGNDLWSSSKLVVSAINETINQ